MWKRNMNYKWEIELKGQNSTEKYERDNNGYTQVFCRQRRDQSLVGIRESDKKRKTRMKEEEVGWLVYDDSSRFQI